MINEERLEFQKLQVQSTKAPEQIICQGSDWKATWDVRSEAFIKPVRKSTCFLRLSPYLKVRGKTSQVFSQTNQPIKSAVGNDLLITPEWPWYRWRGLQSADHPHYHTLSNYLTGYDTPLCTTWLIGFRVQITTVQCRGY